MVLLLAETIGAKIAGRAVDFLFIVILGGIVGLVLSTVKRRREEDLSSLGSFHDAYGHWFAVWKQWTAVCKGRVSHQSRDEMRAVLLQRAVEAEAELEALLVKVATERRLTHEQMLRLGRFRQGYQRLRESIEENVALRWWIRGPDENVGPYVVFKALATEFASLLDGGYSWRTPSSIMRPTPTSAQRALVTITSWQPEEDDRGKPRKDDWWRVDGNPQALEHVHALLASFHTREAIRVSSRSNRAPHESC